jgi:hypothetical protein
VLSNTSLERLTWHFNSPDSARSENLPRLKISRIFHWSAHILGKGGSAMVSTSEIREQLDRYLFGDISLREFEDWFVPATWDAHKAKDPEVDNLADEIEMALSEYTDGQLSSDVLRSRLGSAT